MRTTIRTRCEFLGHCPDLIGFTGERRQRVSNRGDCPYEPPWTGLTGFWASRTGDRRKTRLPRF